MRYGKRSIIDNNRVKKREKCASANCGSRGCIPPFTRRPNLAAGHVSWRDGSGCSSNTGESERPHTWKSEGERREVRLRRRVGENRIIGGGRRRRTEGNIKHRREQREPRRGKQRSTKKGENGEGRRKRSCDVRPVIVFLTCSAVTSCLPRCLLRARRVARLWRGWRLARTACCRPA